MRAVGTCKRMLDMACERALSRETQGELLANKQMTQEKMYVQPLPLRLLAKPQRSGCTERTAGPCSRNSVSPATVCPGHLTF